MDASLLWIVLGSLVLTNAVLSLFVARSPYYSPFQKLVQCSIVWLLPVIGAVVIWAFLRTQEHAEVFDTRAYPERRRKELPSRFRTPYMRPPAEKVAAAVGVTDPVGMRVL